ncbi:MULTISPECIES: response regulator transcription factor [Bradyrhizobium]|uniref:response regulator transcription factor n=1 Tax=Bradyrhizobium TaxID=374 RepID=UPI001BA629C5|nr:response regulator transcription factor [Bradyrhizobium liaoningense]MBR0984332.1 response regulator transcription factor [Bradyrhizobium liaoningense]GMO46268.1 response regulator transcription factor [Bradyrhizobium sp. TM233]GMP12499.1 response regulator transcription factor [Bradyrhizobium sp. TM239]
MRRIRIVIADRHPIVLQGIRSVLAAQRDFVVVASCGDGASCIEAIRFLAPDVALVDAALPDFSRQQILARANAVGPRAPVIFFTGIKGDSELKRLALDGACIVLSKDSDVEMLVATLRKAAQGQAAASGHVSEDSLGGVKPLTQLTDRERQIMRLVSEGLSNKEIGRRLNLADGTIKVHLHHIFQKLEISNRTVLAALAISRSELHAAPGEPDSLDLLRQDPANAS